MASFRNAEAAFQSLNLGTNLAVGLLAAWDMLWRHPERLWIILCTRTREYLVISSHHVDVAAGSIGTTKNSLPISLRMKLSDLPDSWGSQIWPTAAMVATRQPPFQNFLTPDFSQSLCAYFWGNWAAMFHVLQQKFQECVQHSKRLVPSGILEGLFCLAMLQCLACGGWRASRTAFGNRGCTILCVVATAWVVRHQCNMIHFNTFDGPFLKMLNCCMNEQVTSVEAKIAHQVTWFGLTITMVLERIAGSTTDASARPDSWGGAMVQLAEAAWMVIGLCWQDRCLRGSDTRPCLNHTRYLISLSLSLYIWTTIRFCQEWRLIL